MVWAVWRTILCFFTDLSIICNLQPRLRCAGCTQTRMHMLTCDTCNLSSICGRKPQQWTQQLCHVLTYLLVFICWVPQITLTLPQVHKWGHFLQSERLKTFKQSAMCCHPSFFLFHNRALRFQSIRTKVRQTQQIVPTACRAKRFGPWTQLHRSLANCPNQVCIVKIRLIKNKLSSPNFFQVRQTPQTRSTKQKFIQLRMGFYMKMWGRRQGRQRKRWEDSIREWTGQEFVKSQRAVENREKWRKHTHTHTHTHTQAVFNDRWSVIRVVFYLQFHSITQFHSKRDFCLEMVSLHV